VEPRPRTIARRIRQKTRERCTFRFVAGAPDTTVHITGQSGKKYIGRVNVSLTYVSPIPSRVNQFVVLAIVILLTFLLVLTFIIRRRSARGA
jgi:hypothetical protein